jgi:hypothetical protein
MPGLWEPNPLRLYDGNRIPPHQSDRNNSGFSRLFQRRAKTAPAQGQKSNRNVVMAIQIFPAVQGVFLPSPVMTREIYKS